MFIVMLLLEQFALGGIHGGPRKNTNWCSQKPVNTSCKNNSGTRQGQRKNMTQESLSCSTVVILLQNELP